MGEKRRFFLGLKQIDPDLYTDPIKEENLKESSI